MDFLTSSFDFSGSPVLWLDVFALVWFVTSWLGYAHFADHHYKNRLNLVRIMDDMRTRWMHQILKRENRIADASLLGNLLRSISFFASTCILILLGLVTVLGAQNQSSQIIHAIPFVMGFTPFMFELKISILVMIFVYAFFKLTWSMRQYNYTCILVGAAPQPHELKHQHKAFADRAGKLIGSAGRHFNLGLRAYYFGLAVVSWFVNGLIFMAITSLIVVIIYRREFRSHTVNNLIELDDTPPPVEPPVLG